MKDYRLRRDTAIQGLMASLLDFDDFSKIRLLVFLRTDIYNKLTFINKDHLSDRVIELKWNPDDIVLLIARRIIKSEAVRQHLDIVVPENIGVNEAKHILSSLLVHDSNPLNGTSIDGAIDILLNGQDNVTPRDIIHLYSETLRIQLDDIERGIYKGLITFVFGWAIFIFTVGLSFRKPSFTTQPKKVASTTK
ncbi:hypothetical protein ACFLV6_01320 [Chloroflexota bacterium]